MSGLGCEVLGLDCDRACCCSGCALSVDWVDSCAYNFLCCWRQPTRNSWPCRLVTSTGKRARGSKSMVCSVNRQILGCPLKCNWLAGCTHAAWVVSRLDVKQATCPNTTYVASAVRASAQQVFCNTWPFAFHGLDVCCKELMRQLAHKPRKS